MSAIHWSIVLAKIDLVSLYFRLLWYHSILKGSIDQYSKIHSPLACSRCLPWFPDLSRPYVACVKRGSGETYVRSQSLSSESAVKSIPTSVPRRAKKDSNIPSPWEQDWSNALPQGQQRQSNPHPMPSLPPPPHRLYIDRCITWILVINGKVCLEAFQSWVYCSLPLWSPAVKLFNVWRSCQDSS